MAKIIKRCHHCGASIQIYRWPYAKRFLAGLKILYMENNKPVKVVDLVNVANRHGITLQFNQGNQFVLNERWKLIEKVDASHWRLTPLGLEFIKGTVSIPKYVWIFRGEQVERPEDDLTPQKMINVHEVLIERQSKEKAIQNSTPSKTIL